MYSIGVSSKFSRLAMYFVAGYSLGEMWSIVLLRAFVMVTAAIETIQNVSPTRRGAI